MKTKTKKSSTAGKPQPFSSTPLSVCGRVDARTGHACQLKLGHKNFHKCVRLCFSDADCENQVDTVPQLAREVWTLRRLVQQLQNKMVIKGLL